MTTATKPHPSQDARASTSNQPVPGIRLLLVDSRPLRRQALGMILAAVPDMRVVGVAASLEEARELTTVRRPDIVVIDSDGSESFLEAACALVDQCGGRSVLIGRQHEGSAVRRAFSHGISAYLHGATASADELLHAIRAAADGRSYVDPAVGAALASASEGDGLTDREREVVRLLTLGYRNGEVAARLYVSVRTVESHRAHAMTKLRLDYRWQLVRWALDTGLIEASTVGAATS